MKLFSNSQQNFYICEFFHDTKLLIWSLYSIADTVPMTIISKNYLRNGVKELYAMIKIEPSLVSPKSIRYFTPRSITAYYLKKWQNTCKRMLVTIMLLILGALPRYFINFKCTMHETQYLLHAHNQLRRSKSRNIWKLLSYFIELIGMWDHDKVVIACNWKCCAKQLVRMKFAAKLINRVKHTEAENH